LVHVLIGLNGFHRGSPFLFETKLKRVEAHSVSLCQTVGGSLKN